jgi:LacI family transcriptional regulator
VANLKTIADLAGVSTGTASRILNEDQTLSVSSKTREAVITTAAQLKYQTPRARKRAAQKRDQGRVQGKFGVAVLLADPGADTSVDPYYAGLRMGLERRCFDLGLNVTATCDLKTLQQSSTSGQWGCIVVGKAQEQFLSSAETFPGPVVFADMEPVDESYDCVLHDLEAAMFHLLDQLKARGYQRPAFIGGKPGISGKGQREHRERAFVEWARRNKCYTAALVQVDGSTTDLGSELAQKVLAQTPRPDVIVCSTDSMATGAYQAIRKAGLAIPDDISVVGYNDNPAAEFLLPSLTSVRLFPSEIGASCVDLLVERMEGQGVAKKVILRTSVSWRGSTAPA